MARFNRIRLVHVTSLSAEHLDRLRSLSKHDIEILRDLPTNSRQLSDFMDDTDAVLVSTRVAVDAESIAESESLKYIGVYGTHLGLIDRAAAARRNITVTNVDGYCNRETAEFTMDQLGKRFEKHPPPSKRNTVFGIVGLGRVGKELAGLAGQAGYSVLYTSRTRKPELESERLQYAQIGELLKRSDVISLQVPPGCMVLRREEFDLMGGEKILINTSRDVVTDPQALEKWLKNPSHTLILDSVAGRYLPNVHGLGNVVIAKESAWLKESSKKRLGDLLIRNMETYLSSS